MLRWKEFGRISTGRVSKSAKGIPPARETVTSTEAALALLLVSLRLQCERRRLLWIRHLLLDLKHHGLSVAREAP